ATVTGTQVDQLVVRAGRFPEDVLADDPEGRRAVIDVGRHVGGTDQDPSHTSLVDQQAPPHLLGAQAREARLREQLEGAARYHPGRDGYSDSLVLLQSPPPARRAATCSGGRFLVRRPSDDHETSASLRQ